MYLPRSEAWSGLAMSSSSSKSFSLIKSSSSSLSENTNNFSADLENGGALFEDSSPFEDAFNPHHISQLVKKVYPSNLSMHYFPEDL